MNPISLYVLNTEETMGKEVGHRSYLFVDQHTANSVGAQLQRDKPTEVDTFVYWVSPLEGRP